MHTRSPPALTVRSRLCINGTVRGIHLIGVKGWILAGQKGSRSSAEDRPGDVCQIDGARIHMQSVLYVPDINLTVAQVDGCLSVIADAAVGLSFLRTGQGQRSAGDIDAVRCYEGITVRPDCRDRAEND